ncbi:hypothetical protein LZ32DRAFT_461273 [Colletotrichum eremochloae]|nr:hypothetical protein LZ32DRAFT_461273 [Colletotrichum eremochloae]
MSVLRRVCRLMGPYAARLLINSLLFSEHQSRYGMRVLPRLAGRIVLVMVGYLEITNLDAPRCYARRECRRQGVQGFLVAGMWLGDPNQHNGVTTALGAVHERFR